MKVNKKNRSIVIGFDADDTLWENEIFFSNSIKKFNNFLKDYIYKKNINKDLLKVEELNIKYYGYGVKGFILSLIETTLKQFDKKIEVEVIEEILDIGKKMLIEPVKILPNVITTLEYLSKNHILILITKGDLYDQEKKIANSNLSKYFDFLEIISNKTEDEYIKILSKYNVNPKNFLMVGNSLKSDILPVNNLGGTGIYIPSNLTWDHEKIKIEEIPENLITLKNITMLIPYLNNEFPN